MFSLRLAQCLRQKPTHSCRSEAKLLPSGCWALEQGSTQAPRRKRRWRLQRRLRSLRRSGISPERSARRPLSPAHDTNSFVRPSKRRNGARQTKTATGRATNISTSVMESYRLSDCTGYEIACTHHTITRERVWRNIHDPHDMGTLVQGKILFKTQILIHFFLYLWKFFYGTTRHHSFSKTIVVEQLFRAKKWKFYRQYYLVRPVCYDDFWTLRHFIPWIPRCMFLSKRPLGSRVYI